MLDLNAASADEIANDPRTQAILYLVLNGFSYSEATALPDNAINAFVAYFAQANGGE